MRSKHIDIVDISVYSEASEYKLQMQYLCWKQ